MSGIVGIDPGLAGGIAYLYEDQAEAEPMPLLGGEIDGRALAEWLREREALLAIIEPEFEVSEIDQRDAEAIKNQDWAKLYTSYRKRIEDMAVTSDPEVIATMAWSVPLLRAMASGKVPPVIPPRRKRKPAMVMTKDWRGMIGADAKPSTLKITRKILHLLGRAAE